MADLGELNGNGVFGGVDFNNGSGYGDEGKDTTWGNTEPNGNNSGGYNDSNTTWGNNAQGYTGTGYSSQSFYNSQASSFGAANNGGYGQDDGYGTGSSNNTTSKELTKRGFWSNFKDFWLQKIDWNTEIRVELTPYQQKIEDEINEFLHQEITWEKVHNFLFQEIKIK